jgi:hypothetical protein
MVILLAHYTGVEPFERVLDEFNAALRRSRKTPRAASAEPKRDGLREAQST